MVFDRMFLRAQENCIQLPNFEYFNTSFFKALSTEKQINLTMFSYGFTYTARFVVFTVFCNRDLATHPL